jgi:hypothetical protein
MRNAWRYGSAPVVEDYMDAAGAVGTQMMAS